MGRQNPLGANPPAGRVAGSHRAIPTVSCGTLRPVGSNTTPLRHTSRKPITIPPRTPSLQAGAFVGRWVGAVMIASDAGGCALIRVMTTRVPPGWRSDPGDPNTLRYWDGTGWTSDTQPKSGPAAAAPASNPVVAVSTYLTVERILLVLTLISLVLAGFFAFTEVRVAGTSCGSVWNSNLPDLIGSSRFYDCKNALDGRETWQLVASGAVVLFFIIWCIVANARRRLQSRLV